MLPADTLTGRLFITPVEAARILEVDARTVRAALQRGEIPGTKVGAGWKIPTSWLRSQARIGDSNAATA